MRRSVQGRPWSTWLQVNDDGSLVHVSSARAFVPYRLVKMYWLPQGSSEFERHGEVEPIFYWTPYARASRRWRSISWTTRPKRATVTNAMPPSSLRPHRMNGRRHRSAAPLGLSHPKPMRAVTVLQRRVCADDLQCTCAAIRHHCRSSSVETRSVEESSGLPRGTQE